MTVFDTDNLSAPHTQRELGAEPAPAVDVSTEAVMRLLERLRSQEAIPNRGEVADAVTELLARAQAAEAEVARRSEMHECAMAERDDCILDWSDPKAERDRLAAEVARLTAGLSLWIDRAEAAEAEVARLREALAMTVTTDQRRDYSKGGFSDGPFARFARAALRKGGAA